MFLWLHYFIIFGSSPFSAILYLVWFTRKWRRTKYYNFFHTICTNLFIYIIHDNPLLLIIICSVIIIIRVIKIAKNVYLSNNSLSFSSIDENYSVL